MYTPIPPSRYGTGYDMTQYFVYVYVAGWFRENATGHRRHWRPQRIYAHDQAWRNGDDGRNGNQPRINLACLVAIYYVHGVRYFGQAIKNLNFIESNLLGLQDSVLLLPVGRLIHLLEAMQAYLSAHCEIYWKPLIVIFFDSSYVLHFWLNNWIRYSVYALLFFNEPSIQMRIYGLSIINIRRGSQRKTLSFSIRKLKTLRFLIENQWGSQ